MKLPFDLGIKLVLRLLIPGFLLAMGLYPLLAAIDESANWGISLENLVILSSIVAGWIVMSLDQPIYMLFEGRRYLPAWLQRALRSGEGRRLQRLLRTEEATYRQQQGGRDRVEGARRNAEAWVEIRRFPLNEGGEPEAAMPTRLGNLIIAYETYPERRYGADAIFYWYRIWLMLDKDLREELDARQAVADSGLYACAALLASAVLWIAYALLLPLTAGVRPAAGFHAALDGQLPASMAILAIAGAFLLLARAAYWTSLSPQAQYGETFKSVFDLYERRVDVGRVISHVAAVTRHRPTLVEDRRAQLQVAWRYLHNYRVRCPYEGCDARDPMPPEAFADHLQTAHGVVSAHDVPAPAPPPAQPSPGFYTESTRLRAIEQRVWWGRRLLMGIAVAALVAGALLRPTLGLAASGIAAVAFAGEHQHRKRHSGRIGALRTEEAALGLRHLLDPVPAPRTWRAWLPYLVLAVAGVLVFAG
ncbi:MAG TPA: hypothetical protein VF142_12165 [Longimicrobium sp.]